jgi:predicted Na+-dependent transporter
MRNLTLKKHLGLRAPSSLNRTARFLLRQWFFLGLALVVILGCSHPAVGTALHPYVSWMVAGTMFLMTANLHLADLGHGLKHVPAVLFTLCNNFIIMPVFCYLLGRSIFASDQVLFFGMMVLGAAPTTIVSSIVWTRISGSNGALSMMLAILSTLFSILLTPVILSIALTKSVDLPVGEMVFQLFLVLLVPVILAQAARRILPSLAKMERLTPSMGKVIILVMLLTALSLSASYLSWGIVFRAILGSTLLSLCITFFSYYGALFLGIGRRDSIAVLFSSSQKTITVALLVALKYLHVDGLAAIPILTYHFVQQVSAYGWSEFLAEPAPQNVEAKLI